ncbi:MAG: hypothetical protein GQ546_00490 [Gammaproteobacteria bacterium]|nr:hypothetical protein [Gammaproteobacteria bacterium]
MNKFKQALQVSLLLIITASMTQAYDQTQEANPNMSQTEQEALVIQALNSAVGQDILQKQKEQMPKMVKVMKTLNNCLTNADTKRDALKCNANSIALAKKMGLDKEFYDEEKEVDISWSKNEKKEALAEMAIVLKVMETSLPCIEKAETMSDMIKCAPTPAAD